MELDSLAAFHVLIWHFQQVKMPAMNSNGKFFGRRREDKLEVSGNTRKKMLGNQTGNSWASAQSKNFVAYFDEIMYNGWMNIRKGNVGWAAAGILVKNGQPPRPTEVQYDKG